MAPIIFRFVGLVLWTAKVLYAAYNDLNWATATNVLLLFVASGNLVFVVDGFDQQRGLMLVSQILSWSITGKHDKTTFP